MTMTEPTEGETPAFSYLLADTDQHSTPRFSAYKQYMDPAKRHLAITTVRNDDGTLETLYAGRPARLRSRRFQVTFSDDQLSDLGVKGAGSTSENDREVRAVVPGSLLNRLNPLESLDDAGRKEFAQKYREMQPLLDNPEDRLTVMDSQGIEAAVNYCAIANEYEFEDNIEALYANQRAEDRYLAAEWGYAYKNRLFTPPVVSTVDGAAAVAELDALLAEKEPPKLIQIMPGPSIHRSPFRPELDPFWARLNEAHIKICTHLSTVTYYGRQGLEMGRGGGDDGRHECLPMDDVFRRSSGV